LAPNNLSVSRTSLQEDLGYKRVTNPAIRGTFFQEVSQ
jgi:hypothetical protein